jgi:hypothetical protein
MESQVYFLLDSLSDYNVYLTEPMQELQGTICVARDISSPITSDEEYLSPLEEGMDFGSPEPRKIIDTRFKEPPAFQVRL